MPLKCTVRIVVVPTGGGSACALQLFVRSGVLGLGFRV